MTHSNQPFLITYLPTEISTAQKEGQATKRRPNHAGRIACGDGCCFESRSFRLEKKEGSSKFTSYGSYFSTFSCARSWGSERRYEASCSVRSSGGRSPLSVPGCQVERTDQARVVAWFMVEFYVQYGGFRKLLPVVSHKLLVPRSSPHAAFEREQIGDGTTAKPRTQPCRGEHQGCVER